MADEIKNDDWKPLFKSDEPVQGWQLDTLARALIGDVNDIYDKLASLRKQVEATPKSAPGVHWCGIHEHAKRYAEGSLVTRDGSLWLAVDSTDDRPGRGMGWRLIVKGNRRGDDSR